MRADDGRLRRSERTKAEILQACRELMLAGDFRPPFTAVCARAGYSVRSGFDRFGEIEALHLAAINDAAVRDAILRRVAGDADRIVRAAVLGRA